MKLEELAEQIGSMHERLSKLEDAMYKFQKQQSSLAISNTAANRRLSPDQGNPTSLNLNFCHKLEFPQFDGSNARIWIKKCEKYFELCKIPENQKIDLASLHMTGRAKMWVTIYWYARSGCWSEFIVELVVRFGEGTCVDVCETNDKLEVASESAMKPDIEENSVSGDNILSSVVVSEVANDVLKVAIEPGKGRNPQLETEKVPTTIAPELFDESSKKEKLKVEAYELSKVQISKESIEPMVHLLNSDILLEVTKFDSSHDWGEDYHEQQGLEWRKDQAMEHGTFVSPPTEDIAKNLDSPSNSASLIISTKSMLPPSIVANGGDVSTVNSPVTSTVYSEVQNRCLDHTLPLPSVIKNSFSVIDGPASAVVGNPDEIVELFPCLFGQPSAVLVPGDGKGRAASHITLECALQTHPNTTVIGEEVACKKESLKNVNATDYIADVVCKQAESGDNYVVILVPDGLIGFIPEVPHLIEELNEILASGIVGEGGLWKKKLSIQPLELFEILPSAIQDQLMLERDPHGNVQATKIEIEMMLIQMVETELEQRSQTGSYKSQFKGQSHFFGYEGRCSLPSNFDATYCYVLGYGAGALLHSGNSGLISLIGNVAACVEEWTVGGTASVLQSFHQSFLEGRQFYVSKFIEKSERKDACEESIFTNLYVKNLCEDVTEDVLWNKFSEYGNVSAVVITKDSAGKSKGFGFDEYKAHEGASIEIEDTEPVKPEGWLDDGPAEIENTRKFMTKPVRIRVQRDELIFEGIKQFYVNVDKEEWKREVDWFTFGAFPRVKWKFNIHTWWLSISRLEDKSDVEGKAMLWYHFIKYY